MERLSYIDDGPDRFPESCVEYCLFESTDLRQFFARRREREDILIRELDGQTQIYVKLRREMVDRVGERAVDLFEAAVRLREVESELIWMVSANNLTIVDDEDSEEISARGQRKAKRFETLRRSETVKLERTQRETRRRVLRVGK